MAAEVSALDAAEAAATVSEQTYAADFAPTTIPSAG